MSGIASKAALRAVVNLHSSKIPADIAKSTTALFSAYGGAAKTLPDLSYDYGALERKCSLYALLKILLLIMEMFSTMV